MSSVIFEMIGSSCAINDGRSMPTLEARDIIVSRIEFKSMCFHLSFKNMR